MSVKSCDELGADLFQAQFEHGLELNLQIAQELIELVESAYRPEKKNFEEVRDTAFEICEIEGRQRDAYASFLGRFFGRRGQEQKRKLREAFARPFAPIEAYEDGH